MDAKAVSALSNLPPRRSAATLPSNAPKLTPTRSAARVIDKLTGRRWAISSRTDTPLNHDFPKSPRSRRPSNADIEREGVIEAEFSSYARQGFGRCSIARERCGRIKRTGRAREER